MNSKQDNLKPFRGHLKRVINRTREEARNAKEQEKMVKATDNIKIDCWNDPDEPNNWMFIRLSFKNPLIPNEFIPEIRMILGELFIEHF